MNLRKKIILTTIVLGASFLTNEAKAQVAIGKSDVANSSVLLDFGTDAKGIILPSVDAAPGAVGGTFIFDTTDDSVKVLEEKNGGANDNWTNLTENDEPGVAHSFINTGSDVGEGVIIGADTTTKPGVLVLESTTKALVLPQVENPHLTMPGVIAGTMVYDTASDMLAVFDGNNWSYWK
ncbi:hypothetical protein [Moheibacter lacus]|uniref:Uncharacterized protein n=1 Tax=Moheibacter lacus TaxID=2745851 RepID=A0A838ZU29_9FLAO|nr:hypothetical protein [Moheibacter lacus]MBA5630498.1 hypothetical protein [Moheibacter lacus]